MADGSLQLERMPGDPEPPRVIDAQVVEDATVRARRVPGAPAAGFAAFLDGAQHSHCAAWDGVAPIVAGHVGAVIRVRTDRRLSTWRSARTRILVYAPFAYTARAMWEEFFPSESMVDTSVPDDHGVVPPPHPMLLLERARQAVQHDRERIERDLAHLWCEAESRPLFVDGSLAESDTLANSPCAVGVVKSHRTLYADGAALFTVLSLAKGERSSVIRIAPRGRSSVLSWYLRLRDNAGHDAMWGLVRVEAAVTERVAERADEVSRWILAETAPVAMPDARWDKMAYGILNCEEFLKAVR
ncbi:MAG TPA: hypothetical protein VJ803_10000 [Gemmatimonadaceae bacterium]|nr:hypothetical protein [Gemmatimonadaceae bacterium]